MKTKTVPMLYGLSGMTLEVPESCVVLEAAGACPLPDAGQAVRDALARPIASAPLAELIRARKPKSVAITISDITRPVPNKAFLPPMVEMLHRWGVEARQVVIIIGTGMHRPSTPQERVELVGPAILAQYEVIDHQADRPETLVKVSDNPPVSVNRRFAQADFRIVTGYIEPHFMAGFSGGRKGVCPALVDLGTLQRFHGYETLADPNAENGILQGNPCHRISLEVAKTVGVDFLFNVSITRDRQIAGIYCGDLEQAHLRGCKEVQQFVSATIGPQHAGGFDLVLTNAGGYPLDQTFYQTVKGMCTALPALGENSTMLIVSHCGEKLGSKAFCELMARWGDDWRGFLGHIARSGKTDLDQWELQMQARVLERIGQDKLLLASDGIDDEAKKHIAVTPLPGQGDAHARTQAFIDRFFAQRPDATMAAIPDGPYLLLKND